MHNSDGVLDQDVIAFFRFQLLDWAHANPRQMPWKGEQDPYKIWLSEIILQQTRVAQGLPYYKKFVLHYPSVLHLAEAPEDALMKHWEGLGYYSRARNLHAAAKYVAHDLKGVFPSTYEGLLALPGVGKYTAAAIASFAYGLPYSVLDGNVYRVLARFLGIEHATDTPAAQKYFAKIAQQLLDPSKAAAYNQAIMDFGATCCTPQQAKCTGCPLKTHCVAFLNGKVAELPVKSKGLTRKKRSFYYLVVRQGDALYVRKRREKDIWQGLWEFPHLEKAPLVSPFGTGILQVSAPFRQLLTHQEVTAIFYEIELPSDFANELVTDPILADCEKWALRDLKKNIAFPKVIDCYFQSKALTLM